MGTIQHDPAAAAAIENETGHTAEAAVAIPVHVTEPVRVEERGAHTITTDQVPVSAVPVRVVGKLRTRARLVLSARGGAVFLGASAGVTTGHGFELDAGQPLEVDATAEVWAVNDGTAGVRVDVWAEVREG